MRWGSLKLSCNKARAQRLQGGRQVGGRCLVLGGEVVELVPRRVGHRHSGEGVEISVAAILLVPAVA